MDTNDKKTHTDTMQADDNVSHNAHYGENGEPNQFDERDRKDSTEEWNAEHSRTSRNK